MSIVEFAGMPRSGKTSVANVLGRSADFVVYPERFDLVPENFKNKPYEYNSWYASYVIDLLKKTSSHSSMQILERGILDRIAYGKACFSFGRFTEKQLDEYLKLLIPYANSNDMTVVFSPPPETSLSRAKQTKGIVTDLGFLSCLFEEYQHLCDTYQNVFLLSSHSTIDELTVEVEALINRLKSRYIKCDTIIS